MLIGFKKLNSSGFTLIEIIASIAILGIVVIAFLPVFPQLLSWGERTNDELTASNLLTRVAEESQNIDVHQFFDRNIQTCTDYLPDDQFFNSYSGGFEAWLNVCKEPDVNLFRTHIKIIDDDGRLASESYTYIAGELDE